MDEQAQPGIIDRTVEALRRFGELGLGGQPAGTKTRRQWQEEYAYNQKGHPTLESYIAANGAPYEGY